MEATSYRCPCCGASLTFGADSQEMHCASCDNTFPLESVEQASHLHVEDTTDAQMHWDMPTADSLSQQDASSLHAFRCSTCGAEILTEKEIAATECVYCGNPTILPGVLEGAYKPDGVIPFQKTKEEAQVAFKNHCKGKKLLPSGFYTDARLEKITGVYVPFWLFSCETESDMTFNATRTSVTREGQYMVTRTSHYLIHRGGHINFDQVPVDGSLKMDDTMMESIEPFDAGKIRDFQIAYLSGYQAQRHDVSAESCAPRVNARIRQSVQSVIRDTVAGYHTVTPAKTQVNLYNTKVKQILMPVWLLNTKWNDQMYTFAMNGQTGRFIGDLPTDKGKFWKWLLGLTFGLGIGGCVLLFVLMTMGVI